MSGYHFIGVYIMEYMFNMSLKTALCSHFANFTTRKVNVFS